jgi:hypothetical protein
MKAALKSEILYARETFTKRAKTDECFCITNCDIKSYQFVENISALFSSILAVATVPNDAMEAIVRATSPLGIEAVALPDPKEPSLVSENDSTCFKHSPLNIAVVNVNDLLPHQFIAHVTEDNGKLIWNLAQIDSISVSGELEISIFPQIGELCVAFGMPTEPENDNEIFIADPHLVLPIPPIITESTVNGSTIYVVYNHEELDMVLAKLQQE